MRVLPFAAALLCNLAVACSGGGSSNATATATASTTAAASATPAPAGQPTASATAEAGLLPGVSDEAVAFQTEDGVVIRGHLYSRGGPRRGIVIFLHMFPSDQTGWSGPAQALTATGHDSLTFDFRGYGESEGEVEIDKLDIDLGTALLFLESRDYEEIYLVGASMGGTTALKVAATADVEGVAAVSAPVALPGLSAEAEVGQIAVPKLFVVSESDEPAAAAFDYFVRVAQQPFESHVFDGDAHGTYIFDGPHAEELLQLLSDFVGGP